MKKQWILFLLASVAVLHLPGQTQSIPDQHVNQRQQGNLYNEFYAGYGGLSIFYFTGRMSHSSDFPTETRYYDGYYYYEPEYTEPASPGTFYLGYSRTLNRVINVGFMFGYQNIKYTEKFRKSDLDPKIYEIKAEDQLLTGIARVTFCYLNKPAIRMYSGIGIGITVDLGKVTGDVEKTTERKLWPGGQLTLMGLRFGRSFGGFVEFGIGSYGIMNAGLSYKFSD